MKYLLSILVLVSPYLAEAACPDGRAISRGRNFSALSGNPADGSKLKECDLKNSQLAGVPLEIVGCHPFSEYPRYLLVKPLDGFTHHCFKEPPESILVNSWEFFTSNKVAPRLDPKGDQESGCPEVSPKTYGGLYNDRKDPIFFLMNDLIASENKLKSAESLEKYHSCLLSNPWEKKQNEIYKTKYRHVLQEAATTFDVPLALLTCLCGRESRFQADAVSSTSVKGLCQTTGRTLMDVEKWRKTIPEVGERWKRFVTDLGKKLEDPSCAQAPINSETIARCPSLGFGAASIYLLYANSRVEKNQRFKNVQWQAHGLENLVTIAASYNVGVELTDRALQDVQSAKWQRTLLSATCKQFSKNKNRAKAKFKELKNHMVALRSCLQEDNWLDHHGKPLKAECSMEEAKVSQQKQRLARFEATIPTDCP